MEFAQARYYNPSHGRFTSVDPLTASASIRDPQTFNRYSYAMNSPYKFSDPLGLLPETNGGFTGECSAQSTSCDYGDDTGGFLPVSPNSHTNEVDNAPATAGTSGDDEGGAPTQQEADEPEPPPIPVLVGLVGGSGLGILPVFGAANIEGNYSSIIEERREYMTDPSIVPAADPSQLPPAEKRHETNYFVSFSFATNGASLEGYSYEVTYDNGTATPRARDSVADKQKIGADGEISVGKFYITTVTRGPEGFNAQLTGERNISSSGTITIYSSSGHKVAESRFNATLANNEGSIGYSARTIETSRTTPLGTWNRPSP